ncbi:glycosyltransferase family 2 protein [Mangrovimonas xylaniphaga]|uniref:glycosyltransferase family 2 protein n=1 Tax=Mangrovimonas xylaniphaga TaxID=1645915 RepID=UPI000A3EDF09|nr:glycosyltransferase family 2 protein [Mangrovimonas xylaniphaga]
MYLSTMQQALVSVLTPFKNTADFLPACIKSIQSQTHTFWELIIVDDNSTDNSYEIVNSYAEKDPRIKLFKNNGTGIISALRLAFNESKGVFITRMDSDDIMSPDKLQFMLHDLKIHGKGHIALGLVQYFSNSGHLGNGFQRYETWLNKLTMKGDNFKEIYKECAIPSPCWMVYRTDLEACKAFRPNRYPEDYDLAFRFYKGQLKCIPSNTVLHQWRDYPDRASRTDEHYSKNHFIPLKIRYFLKLDYDNKRPLALWGAGHKGKMVARRLIANRIPFTWLCNNEKKIGKHIYGLELHSFEYLKTFKQPQCIITVANPDEQTKITQHLQSLDMKPIEDYYFFC